MVEQTNQPKIGYKIVLVRCLNCQKMRKLRKLKQMVAYKHTDVLFEFIKPSNQKIVSKVYQTIQRIQFLSL